MEFIRWVLIGVGVVWALAFAWVSLLLVYGLVMEWLIKRAWEPVEALSREIAEEQEAEAAYLSWLEEQWRRPGSRVPRVPRDG